MAGRQVTLKRIAPMSAFRVGLAFALVGLIAWLLAVSILYVGMDAAGIVDQINGLISDVGGEQTITLGVVLALSALVGAIMTVLAIILVPLLTMIYNAAVDIFGGFQLNLADVD